MLLVGVVILTTYPQEDRVAVVIKTEDRHALGEAWASEKAMNATGIYVCSHNLVAIVDPKGRSIVGAGEGDINRAELSVVVYKAMSPGNNVVVDPNDLAFVVDLERQSLIGARERSNNGTECPPVIKKTLL